METYKIVLDVMGSDKGAEVILDGARLALEQNEDLLLVLVGDGATIKSFTEKHAVFFGRSEILESPEEITQSDAPTAVLFEKRRSSMVMAMEYAASCEEAKNIVSVGNTGALITGAIKYIPREDRTRPVLAACLPAESGAFVCVCDIGASVDCTAQNLLHFAKLGSEFMRDMYSISSPKVALLSNGTESTKGNALVKEAHKLLLDCTDINFIGNVEGTNALSGECDVLVCDGFAGNQVLKVTEGTARRIIKDIVKIAKRTGNETYMALVDELMRVYDFNSLGGAFILGCKKPILKAHGAANEMSILNTIEMALNLAKNKTVLEIGRYTVKK